MKKLLRILGVFFLVLIAAHVALNILWGMQLRNTLRDLKAQGKLKTIEELKPPHVPDDENAALLYEKVFELMTTGEGGTPYIPGKTMGQANKRISDIRDFFNEATLDPTKWTMAQEQKFSEIVNAPDIKNLFSIFEEAAKKQECNFNLDYEKGFNGILPPYILARMMAKLFAAKAQLEAKSGNVDKAMDTILTGLRTSNHFKYEPNLISQMIRIADDNIIVYALQNIANSKNASINKVLAITEELSHHKNLPWLTKAMDMEITVGMSAFDKLIQGNIRLSDPAFGGKNFWLSLYGSSPFKPFLKKDMETYLIIMLKMREQHTVPYYKIANEMQNNPIEKQIPFYCVLSKIAIPNLQGILRRATNHQTEIELARIGLAFKIYKNQHGSYPETLNKLAPDILDIISDDPFSGKSLVYKKSGKGFTLYSLGPNMKDDNGTMLEWPLYTQVGKPNVGDIVWKSGK